MPFKLLVKILIMFVINMIHPFSLLSGQGTMTMADQKMIKILNLQEELFSKESIPLSKSELTRKAQDLVIKYESYLSENPNDIPALLLFGKFLRKVDQHDHALGIFLQADSVNPKLAVVKQQIANYLVEKGRPLDALPFFIAATKIEPLLPDYHYHLGNFLFIFKDQLQEHGLLKDKSIAGFSHECFEKAYLKKPSSFEYRLRYAQSFFDCADSNKTKALEVWGSIAIDFNDLSKSEIDYLNLCIARLHIELGNKSLAKTHLDKVSTKSLSNAKRKLNSSMEKDFEIKPMKLKEEKKTGFIHRLNTDPRLKDLQRITSQLREENLINELKIDQIRAYHDQEGDVKLSVVGSIQSD
jgi:tetratricopeptide (TPR) repeat protein